MVLARQIGALIALFSLVCCDRSSDSPAAVELDPAFDGLLKSERLAPFKLTSEHDRRFSRKLMFEAEGGRSLQLEVMEGVDEPSAKTLEMDGIMGLEALYADALSPYPGDISRKLVKDERFRPRSVKTGAGTYYLLYANERLGYGASTSDAVTFASLAGWRYCAENRRFLKIRIFAPFEAGFAELETLYRTIKCSGESGD